MEHKETSTMTGRYREELVTKIQKHFIAKSYFGLDFDMFDRDLAQALLTTSLQPMYVDIVAGLKIDAVLPEVYTTYLYEREGT